MSDDGTVRDTDAGSDTYADSQVRQEAKLRWAIARTGPRDRDAERDDSAPDQDDAQTAARPGWRHSGFGPGGFGPGGFGTGAFGAGPFGAGPFGAGPARRGGGRRPGRGGRGDVRAAVLLLLTEGPMHGYQLIQQITARSGGVWTPSPGSVYPALSQLEDEGLVRLSRVEGRNTASLTDAGTVYIDEHRDHLGAPWVAASDAVSPEARSLRDEVGALTTAAHQLSQVGTAPQLAEASRQLTLARKALYRILAGDEPTA